MHQTDATETKGDRGHDASTERLNHEIVQGIYNDASTFKAATKPSTGADVSQYLGQLTIANESQSSETAPLTLQGLKAQSEKLFDTLDQNHTGSIPMETLARDMGNSHITGEQAKALAALYGFKTLNRGTTDTASDLTRAEVDNLPTSVADENRKAGLMGYLNRHSASSGLDTNEDGRLSPAELTSAKRFLPAAGPDYQGVINEYLTENPNLADAAQIRSQGLTAPELAQAGVMQQDRASEAQSLDYRLSIENQRTGAPTSRQLYADTKNPLNSINMDAIKQGYSGDCYFESSLADVAKLQPSIIEDSIKTNKDGTYTVTFQGDKAHPVTVAPPTEAELDGFNGSSKDGIWASVMEKAFGAYEVKYGGRQAIDETNVEAAAHGDASQAIRLLTGDSDAQEQYLDSASAREPGRGYQQQKDTMETRLAEATSDGEYAVIGTTNMKNLYQYSGLKPDHDYSVIGYTPGANGGTFELRNPYGHAGKNDDYFQISGDALEPHISAIFTAKPQ